jgi:membrane associated rhomboid family serine protease
MIPLRDTVPTKNYPVVNNAIIGINVVIFLYQLTQGIGLDKFIYIYGLVPARYSVPQISAYFSTSQQLFSLFSFMFLHGGFWHLLGNMWSLYIFGDNVEDRLGHVRYLLFYIIYGTIAITPHEAVTGTTKLVNIPWGFHKRLYKVVVPAGIQEGRKLRLKGLGKRVATGQRGDLFLKVLIRA